MNIYTFSSDSHNILLDKYYLPSLPSCLNPIVLKIPQFGSGHFDDDKNFYLSMKEKVKLIIYSLRNEKNIFIYSDCDLSFNKKANPADFILKQIGEADIIAQRDWGGVCGGFMTFKPNETNISFMMSVLDYMCLEKNKNRVQFHDQIAFNELLFAKNNLKKPKILLVDINQGFGNYNHINPGKFWEKNETCMEDNKEKIKNTFLWHANFTVGIENKILMLDRYNSILES